jgi:hypothetical protein
MMARRAGVSPRILDHWVRRGYVVPEQRSLAKSGYPRAFGPDQVRVIEVMAVLVRAGFRPDAAAPLARQIIAPDASPPLVLVPGVYLSWIPFVDRA